MKCITSVQFNIHINGRDYEGFKSGRGLKQDDLILFSKAQPESLQQLINALNEFSSCAGLQPNLRKSQMVFGGASHELQETCMQTVGLNVGSFPLQYLGIPIVSSRLTKIECSALIDKITARVRQWATRTLSYAGRLTLINSILFGMVNYWAAIFLLPTEVIDKLT